MASEGTPSGVSPFGNTFEELNEGTASLGTWYARVFHGKVHEYEYKYQGITKQGGKFQCILISASNEEMYSLGLVKMFKGDRGELDRFSNKFKEGSMWKLQSIVFEREKSQYVHTPIKKVIDLRKTKITPVLQATVSMPAFPSPPATLAEMTYGVASAQRFDISGIVTKVSDTRCHTTSRGARAIVDVTIRDGSTDADGKQTEATVPLYFIPTTNGEDEFRKAVSADKAISFFALTTEYDASISKCKVTTSNEFFWTVANGRKAEALNNKAVELKSLPFENVNVLTPTWTPNEAKDYLAPGATLTTSALLDALAKLNAPLATRNDLFQVNFAVIRPPPAGTTVMTSDGKRVWFSAQLHDYTGSTDVFIREKAALELSGVADATEFQKAFEAGTLRFPLLCTARVVITTRSLSATAASQEPPSSSSASSAESVSSYNSVSLVVVEAQEQDFSYSPTKALLELPAFLQECPQNPSCVLPSFLKDLMQSPQHGLMVNQALSEGPRTRPCSLACVLIVSKQKSVLQELGNNGFRLVTDVEDALATSEKDTLSASFRAVSMCTLENLTDYKLDPPKTGTKVQHALLLLSGINATTTPATIMVEHIQLLNDADAAIVAKVLKQLMLISKTSRPMGSKRPPCWTSEVSPMIAKKCRQLSACPTADDLSD
jgi:hypothetical protein